MNDLLKIRKIQTRLALLGAVSFVCLLFFAGLVMSGYYRSYSTLRNFQQTTQVSILASELAKALTVERQSAYNASGFFGEGSPQDQIAAYRERIQATQAKLRELDALAKTYNDSFSETFRDGLKKAIESDSRLNDLRNEILDTTNRPMVRDENSKLKGKTLSTYDLVLFTHSSFLPLLCNETGDAELARRILTLDNLARFQRNVFKVKGLVATGLRLRKTTDAASAEVKLILTLMDDHVVRIRTLSSEVVVQKFDAFLANPDYVEVVALAQKVRDALNKPDDYKGMPNLAEYQNGPSQRVESLFEGLVASANSQIADYTRQKLEQTRGSLILMGGCIVGAIVMIAVVLGFIARSITRPLRVLGQDLDETAGGAAHSAEVISSSSAQLSKDSSEQAAALEEISASMEELSGMTSSSLSQMKKMSDCAEQAIHSTQLGKENIARLTQAMEGMRKATSDVASIIKVIDEIAFQTNILALNAAVEAARAGESGAGFAVVADEVRNLAQRSAQAAHETAEKIEQAVKSSAQGGELSQLTEKTFAEISEITSRYNDIVREVQAASNESAQGLAQVKSAVLTVDQITQRTAAAAEENAAAASEMKAMVDKVQASVLRLESMILSQQESARLQHRAE